jgi:hypothetical protein
MSSQSPAPAASQAPRRDKFAAMANRSSTAPVPAAGNGRGNKLAAMAATNRPQAATTEEEKRKAEAVVREKRLQGLEEKLSKRKKLLGDLDRAEDLTCKLLQVAHQTSDALQDLSCAPNISALSQTYRETLKELHHLLSEGTEELIQPYQNHSTETKHSMYAARVDMRLAKERTQVLKVITELEKSQRQVDLVVDPVESGSKKRPRDD